MKVEKKKEIIRMVNFSCFLFQQGSLKWLPLRCSMN